MKQEPVGTNNTVTLRLENTMRKFVFILPLFAVLYGLLVNKGWAEGSPIFSTSALVLVIVAFSVLATVQTLVRSTPNYLRAIYIVGYHFALAVALLFVFGVMNPLMIGWLLLIIVTLTFFGKRWAAVSFLIMLSVMALSLMFIESNPSTLASRYAISVVLIGAVAAMFASLRTLEFGEQEKLAESKARQNEQREALLTIINGTTQAIFTVSTGGIIRIYNAALLSLMDTNQSLSGRKVDDVLTLYSQQGEPVSLYELMSGKSHFERDDLSLRFPDGDEIRLHLSVNKVQSAFSPHRQSDDEGFVCIARDITKQKSLEEERDEFISVVSHELRTPVTIAEGTISNVQYFLQNGADPAKLAPSLKDAHEQIVLLASMINDLGTLSRAERGAGDTLEAVDIKELAETVYKSYAAHAAKKGLVLNLDTGARLGTITTSRLYLEEMLQNFVTNSIKYTAEGSVTIQVKRVPTGVEFSVKDTGIGISKTDIKHIFEKFYRSEDYRTRETSGTGLGLYVVTKLMRKLGTKVEVSSRLNHGSTFSFVLPDTPPKSKA